VIALRRRRLRPASRDRSRTIAARPRAFGALDLDRRRMLEDLDDAPLVIVPAPTSPRPGSPPDACPRDACACPSRRGRRRGRRCTRRRPRRPRSRRGRARSSGHARGRARRGSDGAPTAAPPPASSRPAIRGGRRRWGAGCARPAEFTRKLQRLSSGMPASSSGPSPLRPRHAPVNPPAMIVVICSSALRAQKRTCNPADTKIDVALPPTKSSL
jgi:hypothetical protein